ncbi:MAG: transporter substrate-binding domain-containing protein [Muribaculaceae bacterium]|nr:transporter substrate-binding domain-containing protein [Muribaculaceae bacterium]
MQQPFKKKSSGRVALYLILLAAVIGAMIGLRRCGSPSSSAATRPAADTIAVAIQYSPVSFCLEGDTLGGFDYSLLRLTGIPFRLYPVTDPREGLAGLADGRYDMLIADLPQSVADSSRFAFTVPAYIDRQVLVQTVDSAGAAPAVSSVLSLDGDTVYVTKDSPAAERMAHLAAETGSHIHVEQIATTSEKLLIMQALGQIPGPSVVNSQVARNLAADYPRLDHSLAISLSQFQPWVVRSSDRSLLSLVDSRLDSVSRTEAYAALMARYFPD